MGVDLKDFAASEIADFVSAGKSFKSAAKSVGKQTLRKQLRSGSKQRTVIPTRATRQAGRSNRDSFTNISG